MYRCPKCSKYAKGHERCSACGTWTVGHVIPQGKLNEQHDKSYDMMKKEQGQAMAERQHKRPKAY